MRIRRFRVANYKAYRADAVVVVRPLTLVVGRNHSGKSSLLRALPLLAHSLMDSERQIIALEAGGLRHGSSLEDVVHGQHVHGKVELGCKVEDTQGPIEIVAQVQNVIEPGKPAFEVVNQLTLRAAGSFFECKLEERARQDYPLIYTYQLSEYGSVKVPLEFDGLLPKVTPTLDNQLSTFLTGLRERLRPVADSIHYLRAQRTVPPRFLALPAEPPDRLESDGALAPQLLATDDGIARAARDWFKRALNGIAVDVVRSGPVFWLTVTGGPSGTSAVHLENAGHGLSQVLPVVVQRLAGQSFGPGIDLIEQPESDLHPGAHGAIADLFVDGVLAGSRDAVVETHSEMFLLRIRRHVAEGRLDPAKVAVYWVDADPNGGALLQEVRITPNGDVEGWPQGVFYEDFDEVMAIRRAGREVTVP